MTSSCWADPRVRRKEKAEFVDRHALLNRNPRALSKAGYDQVIQQVANLNLFNTSNSRHNYTLENRPDSEGTMQLRLVEKEKGLTLLPLEEVFDEIHRLHIEQGHKSATPLHAIIKQTMKIPDGNISLAMVKDFVSHCPACAKKSQNKKKNGQRHDEPVQSDEPEEQAQINAVEVADNLESNQQNLKSYAEHRMQQKVGSNSMAFQHNVDLHKIQQATIQAVQGIANIFVSNSSFAPSPIGSSAMNNNGSNKKSWMPTFGPIPIHTSTPLVQTSAQPRVGPFKLTLTPADFDPPIQRTTTSNLGAKIIPATPVNNKNNPVGPELDSGFLNFMNDSSASVNPDNSFQRGFMNLTTERPVKTSDKQPSKKQPILQNKAKQRVLPLNFVQSEKERSFSLTKPKDKSVGNIQAFSQSARIVGNEQMSKNTASLEQQPPSNAQLKQSSSPNNTTQEPRKVISSQSQNVKKNRNEQKAEQEQKNLTLEDIVTKKIHYQIKLLADKRFSPYLVDLAQKQFANWEIHESNESKNNKSTDDFSHYFFNGEAKVNQWEEPDEWVIELKRTLPQALREELEKAEEETKVQEAEESDVESGSEEGEIVESDGNESDENNGIIDEQMQGQGVQQNVASNQADNISLPSTSISPTGSLPNEQPPGENASYFNMPFNSADEMLAMAFPNEQQQQPEDQVFGDNLIRDGENAQANQQDDTYADFRDFLENFEEELAGKNQGNVEVGILSDNADDDIGNSFNNAYNNYVENMAQQQQGNRDANAPTCSLNLHNIPVNEDVDVVGVDEDQENNVGQLHAEGINENDGSQEILTEQMEEVHPLVEQRKDMEEQIHLGSATKTNEPPVQAINQPAIEMQIDEEETLVVNRQTAKKSVTPAVHTTAKLVSFEEQSSESDEEEEEKPAARCKYPVLDAVQIRTPDVRELTKNLKIVSAEKIQKLDVTQVEKDAKKRCEKRKSTPNVPKRNINSFLKSSSEESDNPAKPGSSSSVRGKNKKLRRNPHRKPKIELSPPILTPPINQYRYSFRESQTPQINKEETYFCTNCIVSADASNLVGFHTQKNYRLHMASRHKLIIEECAELRQFLKRQPVKILESAQYQFNCVICDKLFDDMSVKTSQRAAEWQQHLMGIHEIEFPPSENIPSIINAIEASVGSRHPFSPFNPKKEEALDTDVEDNDDMDFKSSRKPRKRPRRATSTSKSGGTNSGKRQSRAASTSKSAGETNSGQLQSGGTPSTSKVGVDNLDSSGKTAASTSSSSSHKCEYCGAEFADPKDWSDHLSHWHMAAILQKSTIYK